MAVPLPGFGCKGNEGAGALRSLYISLCVTPASLTCLPALAASSGVARAADGDTLVMRGKHIRLFGVDAFEHDQMCGRFACGREATRALGALVQGRKVTCEKQDVDRYGRSVAICWLDDGRDLGREMVRQGLAVAYRTFSSRYIGDEERARRARTGAWAQGFDSPLKYRKTHPR